MKPTNEVALSSPFTELPTCFVCGTPRCAQTLINVRQNPLHPNEPHFLFLEMHEPPLNSLPMTTNYKVLACSLCQLTLHKQFENYEDRHEDHSKRIYWIKREDGLPFSGVVSGMQAEYASHVLGLSHESTNDDRCSVAVPNRNYRNNPAPSKSFTPKLQLSPMHVPAISPIRMNVRNQSPAQTSPHNSYMSPVHLSPTLNAAPPLSANTRVPSFSSVRVNVPQEEALDLTVESKRSANDLSPTDNKRMKGSPESDSNSIDSLGVLDLSMPDRNSSTVVCYVCGKHYSRGSLINMYTFKGKSADQPFFPSLMNHARPSQSHPVESSGCVRGCKSCFIVLCTEWSFFNMKAVDHKARDYYSGKPYLEFRQNSVICYECNHFIPSNEAEIVFAVNSERSFPLEIEKRGNPSIKVARIICVPCKLRIHTDNLSEGSKEIDICETSPEHAAESLLTNCNEPQNIYGDVNCYACHRLHPKQSLHWLNTVLDVSSNDQMFFPIVRSVQSSNCNVISEKKVLVCSNCYDLLVAQWQDHETLQVPLDKRTYNIPNAKSSLQNLSMIGNNFASGSNNNSFMSTIADVSRDAVPNNEMQLSIKNLELVPLKQDLENSLPPLTTQNPLRVPANCYLCGILSPSGDTYIICSRLQNYTEMYFPFLESFVSPSEMSTLGQNNYLSCSFCFHSLVEQWQGFENIHKDPHERTYNLKRFTCYLCTLNIIRSRLHKLKVELFPFLKNHVRQQHALTVDCGQAVVTCQDCHEGLTDQFNDMEKCGVPIEKREYNWKKIPAPPLTNNVKDVTKHSTEPPHLSSFPQHQSSLPPHHSSLSSSTAPLPSTSGRKVNEKPGASSPSSVVSCA